MRVVQQFTVLCATSVVAFFAFAAVPSTSAQSSAQRTPSATSDPHSNTASAKDKAFMRKALQGGMAEVQMGQLAAQQGNSNEVKQFGQKMVDDHGKMNDQMKQAAEQMSVTVPAGPSAKQKAEIAKLKTLHGDAFDKEYIQTMVRDHKQDNQEFEQEAKATTNANLKQTVTDGDNTIREHLDMIQKMAQNKNMAMK